MVMDNDTVKILLDIQKDVSSTKALVESLTGKGGRIAALEATDTRQWYLSVAAPLLVLAHGVARKFGVQI